MDDQQYGKLFSFIWNIANDVLVFAFEKGDCKKIILPFTVLRRIDVLLEETKSKVLEKKAFCDKNKLPYEHFLPPVTGCPFYNASAFTMSTLKNEINPQRLKRNLGDPQRLKRNLGEKKCETGAAGGAGSSTTLSAAPAAAAAASSSSTLRPCGAAGSLATSSATTSAALVAARPGSFAKSSATTSAALVAARPGSFAKSSATTTRGKGAF